MPKPSIFGVPTTVLSNYGGVLIDAVLTRTTRRTWENTKNPIESGAQISDHRFKNLLTFELEGQLTDTPFAFTRVTVAGPRPITTNFARALIPAPGAAQSAFDSLVELADQDTLFQIVHGNKLFNNIQFAELTEIGRPDDGYSIRFTATLEQLLIIDNTLGPSQALQQDVASDVNNGAAAAFGLGFQATLAVTNSQLLPNPILPSVVGN